VSFDQITLFALRARITTWCTSFVDIDGDLRGRWKLHWLLYHDRDKDRCRHNHFYLTWLHRSDRYTRLGLNFWLFRLLFANNVAIFIDLYDF
jgi:hypothetical protein